MLNVSEPELKKVKVEALGVQKNQTNLIKNGNEKQENKTLSSLSPSNKTNVHAEKPTEKPVEIKVAAPAAKVSPEQKSDKKKNVDSIKNTPISKESQDDKINTKSVLENPFSYNKKQNKQ